MIIFISATISFSIACIGWFLLEKRANRTSKRSETFSLITPVITILNDLEDMTEKQLHAHFDADISNDATSKKKLLGERLVFSTKSLSKFDLLRSKLTFLEDRKILMPMSRLIKLKQSLTLSNIDDISKYQIVLHSSRTIQLELQNAFERKYK